MKRLLVAAILGLSLVACGGSNAAHNTENIVLGDGTRIECNQAERSPDNAGWLCTKHLEFDSAGYPTKSEVSYYPDAPIPSPSVDPYG